MEARKHYVYYDDNFYAVGCNETGDIIDVFPDKAQAIKAIIDFEKSDKAEGIFEPEFYAFWAVGDAGLRQLPLERRAGLIDR